MMRATLAEIAEFTGGRVFGANLEVHGLSIDSRTIRGGELFVALPGRLSDGHLHVAAARQAGAAAALVRRQQDDRLAQVVVDDPARAMAGLAANWRARLDVETIGVTGSNGKTTVKEMLASILTRVGPTLATSGNFNNELGVPLTLARLNKGDRYAVIEMGCGQPGDIGLLAKLARPRVGLVNNAGPAHLERLGSVENVARTKGELFSALPADGVAVINSDDPFAGLWRDMAGHCQIMTFGESAAADVRGLNNAAGWFIEAPGGRFAVRLGLPGRHNRCNALAAAAAALAVGVDRDVIADGLAGFSSLPGRLTVFGQAGGWRLIDDSYNANPASLSAALEVLCELPGQAWLVLGDMAELGRHSERLHREMGVRARSMGVDRLWAVGPASAASAAGFGTDGRHFKDQDQLIDAVRTELHSGVNVLIKGSRSMAMERVVERLKGGPG